MKLVHAKNSAIISIFKNQVNLVYKVVIDDETYNRKALGYRLEYNREYDDEYYRLLCNSKLLAGARYYYNSLHRNHTLVRYVVIIKEQ